MEEPAQFNTQLFDFLFVILAILLLLDIRRKLQKTQLATKEPLVVDTSALIDGRILEIINSGFIDGRVIVPKFILNELQLLADGSDSHKRERARFGLDVAKELKEHTMLNTDIDRYLEQSTLPTDERLLKLCQKRRGKLCTTDFNLNKVAAVEGIKVLNVNELAQSIRTKILPGETTKVKLIQRGESRDQAIGYLGDGTLIVVDKASGSIGKTVEVRIERSLQTVAGKMIFAKIVKHTKSIK